MKTIKLIIAIISLAALALLTGCSGGGGTGTPGNSKVGLKVVFANTSSNTTLGSTVQSLGIHSLILEIVPANPAINLNLPPYQSSYDLISGTGLNKTITLPDPVAPATSEQYLFRITAWNAANQIFYCGQTRASIQAGNNTIDLTTFAFNGFDSAAGQYTVTASDNTETLLTLSNNGRGSGTSSAGSVVTAYLAPNAQGLFDVTVSAKNAATNSLDAYGSGSFNGVTGIGSGSVNDLSRGGTQTWTIAKRIISFASTAGTYDGTTLDANGIFVDTFSITIDSGGKVSGSSNGGFVISGGLTSQNAANTSFRYSGTSTNATNSITWQGSLDSTTGIINGTYVGATTGSGTWSGSKRSTTAGSTAQSVLRSGLYSPKKRSYSSVAGPTQAYAIELVGLAADGVTLTDAYNYYDRTSSTTPWTTTLPAGIPTSLFGNNAGYFLTRTGWVSSNGGPQNYVIVFNADGSSSLTNKIDGSSENLTYTSTDISTQTFAAQGAELSFWPILTNAGVFPSGSIRYDMTWTRLTDSYVIWLSSAQPATITTLAQVTSSPGLQGFLDTSDRNFSYYTQFQTSPATGITTVNIYQRNPAAPAGTPPVNLGAGTYAIITVNGQQILEITVPPTLRTQYKLGGNPIYGIVNGTVYNGSHDLPGVEYTNGNTNWNSVANQHLLNSFSISGAVTATW